VLNYCLVVPRKREGIFNGNEKEAREEEESRQEKKALNDFRAGL
jgi:hypothetical protein